MQLSRASNIKETYQNKLKKKKTLRRDDANWVIVAHTCNPSYSGDRDQRIVVQSQPR
jgi:hypothetical protein